MNIARAEYVRSAAFAMQHDDPHREAWDVYLGDVSIGSEGQAPVFFPGLKGHFWRFVALTAFWFSAKASNNLCRGIKG